MPLAGLAGSDLPRLSGFQTIRNPYGSGEVVVIPAIQPQVCLLHVQEADTEGDLRIEGAHYEDVLLAKASRRVIATAERIVPRSRFEAQPELTSLPGFLVEAVVEAPRGAWPTSCHGVYSYDAEYLSGYAVAAKTAQGFATFVAERVIAPPARARNS
jgi:glutaconate CoA-transferase subunit A